MDMKIIRCLEVFGGHFDWFIVDPEKGYIPTDKAPKEAVEAMKEYNEEYFWHPERLK